MDYVISILPQMWEGTLETIRLFAITIVLSIPLGVLLALGRVSGFKALRDIIGVYVWLLRGTPLMLQLLFVAARYNRCLCMAAARYAADAAIAVCILRPAVYSRHWRKAG